MGVGLAAGTARNTKVMQHGLKQFKMRLPRFQALRRAGVNTATIVRTGGGAALMYGYHTLGVAPSVLLHMRRAVCSAAAMSGGLSGQELELAMMIADGSKKGKADPADAAHTDVISHWAKRFGTSGYRSMNFRPASPTPGRG